ncbi:hypothetical protein PG993_008649 [Apiospora rasikravindrae]|uniref:Uncharacterized protein n=1 Tax=Apiospora rasikravindrae TaxID=990691 RepID=A0ABR1SS32_9PEZI
MYRPSKHTSVRRATGAHLQFSNMSLSETHEAHHIDKTAGPGMETTASYIPEPVRPRNSSKNQTAAKLPIFVGDELVTRHAKGVLMKLGSNHTTHALTRPGRATLRDPPRLQTSFTPGLSVIGTSSSASSMETPPAEACQTTAPRQRLLGVHQSFAKLLEDWKNMPGTSAQSTSGDPQDNGAGGHDRQALDFHQHPNRLPVVNDKTGKAVNPAREPYLKPLDITCMPDGWAVISPKRKARLQGNSSAPNSYAAAAQVSLQNEAAKDEGGLPPSKRQRRNASPPCHTVVTHDSPTAGRLSPPSAASMITVISEVGSYEAMRIPSATTHFTGGELSFHDARLSCVLPQDFPYPLAKIGKPVEKEGMLKFDVTWKPVFVSFSQIRGKAAAVANLAANLPIFAASKSCYDTRKDTAVPKAATTFGIETFKSWEMVLRNGERTLLLEVCFPNSLVEFKDLDGVETMNAARKLVMETFGKTEGNRLLRIQPSR